MIYKILICAVIAFFMLINFSSCTVLGFITGAKVDTDLATVIPPITKKRIKSDTPVKLIMHNRSDLKGVFLEFVLADSAEYDRRYAFFRNSSDANRWFPAMNDTLVVSKQLGHTTMTDPCFYLFKGFDINSIRLQSPADNRPRSNNLDSLVTITNRLGKKANVQLLRGYVARGEIPLASELLLQASSGLQRIPGEEIEHIHLPPRTSGRVALTLTGLALDILVFRLIVEDMNNSLSEGLQSSDWNY
jgi:hypothetical protein